MMAASETAGGVSIPKVPQELPYVLQSFIRIITRIIIRIRFEVCIQRLKNNVTQEMEVFHKTTSQTM